MQWTNKYIHNITSLWYEKKNHWQNFINPNSFKQWIWESVLTLSDWVNISIIFNKRIWVINKKKGGKLNFLATLYFTAYILEFKSLSYIFNISLHHVLFIFIPGTIVSTNVSLSKWLLNFFYLNNERKIH